MKKYNVLLFIFIAASVFLGSCTINDDEVPEFSPKTSLAKKLNLTAPEIRFMDSVATKMLSQNLNDHKLKAGLVVNVSAQKLICAGYRLTVRVNGPLCLRSGDAALVAYWTLFDSANGKIINLTPTLGNPCINGIQIQMNYTIGKPGYVYFVLLLMEPKTRTVQGLFISNNVLLTPAC